MPQEDSLTLLSLSSMMPSVQRPRRSISRTSTCQARCDLHFVLYSNPWVTRSNQDGSANGQEKSKPKPKPRKKAAPMPNENAATPSPEPASINRPSRQQPQRAAAAKQSAPKPANKAPNSNATKGPKAKFGTGASRKASKQITGDDEDAARALLMLQGEGSR